MKKISNDRYNNEDVDSLGATVSVIMNCLNGEKFLRQAIDSVFAQTYDDWKIIFWEDLASNDNSGKIAQSYGSKLRYFKADVSLPLYGARNLALKEAKGKYIAFLDCDDMWLPDKLKIQVKAFEENKNVGLIHTNVEILEQNGFKRVLHRKIQPSGKVFKELLRDYRINLQSAMISRATLNSLNYWFDRSMLYSGDADLFLRIAHDWDVLYLPQILAQYREHGSSLSATRIEKIIDENEKIIINLSERYDDFMNQYKHEISKLRLKAALSVIIAKWKYSRRAEARKYIVKYCSKSLFLLMLFPLTFLPFKFIHFVKYRVINLFIK